MRTTYGSQLLHQSHWACATDSRRRSEVADVIAVQRKRGEARLRIRIIWGGTGSD
jgi:hypothetical protein